MPGGNRQGPNSMGPKTGRAAGLCAGNPTPGYDNPTPGAGFGRGRGMGGGRGGRGGRGRGMGGGSFRWVNDAPAPAAPVSEKEALAQQAQTLQAQLDALNQRLDAMQ